MEFTMETFGMSLEEGTDVLENLFSLGRVQGETVKRRKCLSFTLEELIDLEANGGDGDQSLWLVR